jgi:hypothetical protein
MPYISNAMRRIGCQCWTGETSICRPALKIAAMMAIQNQLRSSAISAVSTTTAMAFQTSQPAASVRRMRSARRAGLSRVLASLDRATLQNFYSLPHGPGGVPCVRERREDRRSTGAAAKRPQRGRMTSWPFRADGCLLFFTVCSMSDARQRSYQVSSLAIMCFYSLFFSP